MSSIHIVSVTIDESNAHHHHLVLGLFSTEMDVLFGDYAPPEAKPEPIHINDPDALPSRLRRKKYGSTKVPAGAVLSTVVEQAHATISKQPLIMPKTEVKIPPVKVSNAKGVKKNAQPPPSAAPAPVISGIVIDSRDERMEVRKIQAINSIRTTFKNRCT